MTDEREEQILEVPSGLSNPWKFVQKRIIFEFKIRCSFAFTFYEKIYARGKINEAKLQECVSMLKQLYIEIKESAKKNKKVKNRCGGSLSWLDELIMDPDKEIENEDFPELYSHYISVMDMLYYMDLTNIEKGEDDPGKAISKQGG